VSRALLAANSRTFLIGLLGLSTLVIPLAIWRVSVGNPLDYFAYRVPPGQTLYAMSKLSGLLALAFYWLQCMTALARFVPALRGFVSLNRRQHVALGTTIFLLVLTHVALFIAASTARTGHSALHVLLPKFDAGYFSAYVSLGAIAFWGLGIAICAGWRRWHGQEGWKWVHRGVFVVFAVGFLHGVSIGSETRFGLMSYLYAFFALSLSAATCSVAWLELKRRRRQAKLDRGP
jgi:predicted ferric reductase